MSNDIADNNNGWRWTVFAVVQCRLECLRPSPNRRHARGQNALKIPCFSPPRIPIVASSYSFLNNNYSIDRVSRLFCLEFNHHLYESFITIGALASRKTRPRLPPLSPLTTAFSSTAHSNHGRNGQWHDRCPTRLGHRHRQQGQKLAR